MSMSFFLICLSLVLVFLVIESFWRASSFDTYSLKIIFCCIDFVCVFVLVCL